LEKVLNRGKLNGLGFTNNIIPFSQVVELYNAGITTDEIQAWVWYRRSNGVAMTGWDDYYIKDKEEAQLKRMVLGGSLFYYSGKLLPFPAYAYGNMYDRELQLTNDREKIVSLYNYKVYDRHLEVIQQSKPRQLTITDPDPKERPKILAISTFAQEFNIS